MTECKVKKRFSNEDGIGNEKHKDRAVNKLFIVSLAENVAESHLNFEKIFTVLKLNDFQYLSAFDMKLTNIFFGIESAASTHPYLWCNISKEEMQDSY